MRSDAFGRSYLRYPDGKYITFNHPDAGTNGATGQGTRVASLNALGAVAGSVRDANNFDIAFARDADGNFHSVNFENFGSGNGQAINLWGAMVKSPESFTTPISWSTGFW